MQMNHYIPTVGGPCCLAVGVCTGCGQCTDYIRCEKCGNWFLPENNKEEDTDGTEKIMCPVCGLMYHERDGIIEGEWE